MDAHAKLEQAIKDVDVREMRVLLDMPPFDGWSDRDVIKAALRHRECPVKRAWERLASNIKFKSTATLTLTSDGWEARIEDLHNSIAGYGDSPAAAVDQALEDDEYVNW